MTINFNGGATQEFPAKILQIVQSTFTSTTTTNSTSYVDTGLSVSITPQSTSSKVLLICSFNFGQTKNPAGTQDNMKQFSLFRGSTNVAPANGRFFAQQNENDSSIDFNEQVETSAITFLDTPSTTSSTTYKLRMQTDTTVVTIMFNSRSHGGGDHKGVCSLIAMEVGS